MFVTLSYSVYVFMAFLPLWVENLLSQTAMSFNCPLTHAARLWMLSRSGELRWQTCCYLTCRTFSQGERELSTAVGPFSGVRLLPQKGTFSASRHGVYQVTNTLSQVGRSVSTKPRLITQQKPHAKPLVTIVYLSRSIQPARLGSWRGSVLPIVPA